MSDQAQVESPQSVEQRIEAMFLPKEEEPQEQKPVEVEQQEAKPEEQEPTPAEPEVAEVEIEGELYQVPAKIKDRFIQHADYTRKTQELAEARRSLAAKEQVVQLQAAFHQSVKDEMTQLASIESQMSQFQKLDWQTMDTDQLVRTKHQLDQLRDAKSELEKNLQAKGADFQKRLQEERQKAIDAGLKYVQQKVKTFNDATAKELVNYGVSEGYTQDELSQLVDPRVIVTMWKAQQWDKLQASKPSITNKASQAAPVIKPSATPKQVSHKDVLTKQIRESKDPRAKARAAEEYFASILK